MDGSNRKELIPFLNRWWEERRRQEGKVSVSSEAMKEDRVREVKNAVRLRHNMSLPDKEGLYWLA
jgi:hypothetical protein